MKRPASAYTEVASILSCGVGTGYRALRAAGTSADDVVVVTGAGGGVGVHAVEVTAGLGARVLAVTSNEHKIEALIDAGAEHLLVLNPGMSIRDAVRQQLGAAGVDIVVEVAGPPTFEGSLAALRAAGVLAVVGNTEPRAVPVNPGLLILKEIVVRGSAHATLEDLRVVVALAAEGKVRPVVADVRPLRDAGRTHEQLELRLVTGRMGLMPEQGVA